MFHNYHGITLPSEQFIPKGRHVDQGKVSVCADGGTCTGAQNLGRLKNLGARQPGAGVKLGEGRGPRRGAARLDERASLE